MFFQVAKEQVFLPALIDFKLYLNRNFIITSIINRFPIYYMITYKYIYIFCKFIKRIYG